MEEKQYQLMCTYFKGKYFISTVYRPSSAMIENLWYFETIVWEWNDKTKERGKMIDMEDSGLFEDYAIENHMAILKKLNE